MLERVSLRAAFRDPLHRRLLLTGFFAFTLLGALQAMYGPAFIALRSRFALSASEVGLIVSLSFLGGTLAIFVAGFVIGWLGYRRLLVASAGLVATGTLGIALAPSWALTLAATFIAGLGFGGIIMGLNTLFAGSFGTRGAAALNLLNAMFGLGAVTGPLVIALFLPHAYAPAFALVTVAALGMLALFWRLELPRDEAPNAPQGEASLLLTLLGFIVMYFLYVGTEVSTGSWIATHLTPELGEVRAAGVTSLFWVGLMVGRFLAAPLTIRVGAPQVVVGSSALAVVACTLAHLTPVAPAAYALAGLALAPIFPTGLAWLSAVFPRRAARAASLVMACANVGGVLFPPLVGVTVDLASSHVIPSALLVLASACCLAAVSLWFRTRSSPLNT
jgi:fucose permease